MRKPTPCCNFLLFLARPYNLMIITTSMFSPARSLINCAPVFEGDNCWHFCFQQSTILNPRQRETEKRDPGNEVAIIPPPYWWRSVTTWFCKRHQLLLRMTDAEQSFVRRKMAATKRYFGISLLIFFLISVCCLPEPGKRDLHFNGVSNICLGAEIRCWILYFLVCKLCWRLTPVSLILFACGSRFVYGFVLKIGL